VPVGPDVTPAGVLRPAVTCWYTLPFRRAGAATDASVRVDTCKWIVDPHGTAIVDTGERQNSWPAPIERMAAAAASRLLIFLHAEAASGIVLVAAAATALVWVKGSVFPFEESLVTSAVVDSSADSSRPAWTGCRDALPYSAAARWFPDCAPRVRLLRRLVGATVRWTAQPTPSDPAERCWESSARRRFKCVSATLPWRMGSATHFGARARALR
jgi:hypothetical protein